MNYNSHIKGWEMTENEEELLSYIKILADRSKYKIILHLMKGQECVCVLAEKLNLEQTLVSHHLRKLRKAGLIHDRKIGTWVYCSLNKKAFKKMKDLFRRVLNFNSITSSPGSRNRVCRKLQGGKL